ncbi:MAG: D-alanine--D-alanine ligase [Spirochaetes bacterium]|nr:D-alanine--D-alanine ligase [Spirochaetota bacterium]
MTSPTVAIVYGQVRPDAPPDEQDALVQVNAVRAALGRLGYQAIDVPLTLDLGVSAAVLRSSAPLLAFNLTETINGHGRLIHLAPSLLDSLGIPYTGALAEAIYLTSHKILAKRALACAGIDTPPWAAAARGAPPFPPPYIVKSIWEHASIGMEDSSVAGDPSALAAEIERRAVREGIENLFVEGYIEGREFNLGLLSAPDAAGKKVLPPAEIQFVGYPEGKPRVVGYRAKWVDGSFEYGNTRRRFSFPPDDQPLLAALAHLARACWDLFGLRGYARVDFRVDQSGRPWILEINANPCIAPDAGFMAAAAQAGLTIDEVVARIIADTKGGIQ